MRLDKPKTEVMCLHGDRGVQMKCANSGDGVSLHPSASSPRKPLVSVIVPTYNGGSELDQSLKALSSLGKDAFEIIVVDDHSTENILNIAQKYGARYLCMPKRGGPAAARNLGAERALGEIIVFVDSDVLVPPDALSIIREEFESHPDIVALFGSYDDTPACPDFWSSFKNLMHHHVHQSANSDASTFWAGCGAIRKQNFKDLGGFDAMKYTKACIEDIELGFRLTQQSQKIRLVKRLQVKHLKKWTLKSVVHTDLFQRAVPWTQLILRARSAPRDLNLTWTSRFSATLVGLAAVLVTGLIADLFGLTRLPIWVLAIGLALIAPTLFLLNKDLYGFFWQKRGSRFALGAMGAHWLYFFYSGVAFLVCSVTEAIRGRFRLAMTGSKRERLRRSSDQLVDAD